jgi:hypothetical protein
LVSNFSNFQSHNRRLIVRWLKLDDLGIFPRGLGRRNMGRIVKAVAANACQGAGW